MKIRVISPSAPSVHTDERKGQFEKGLATLGKLGFDVSLSPHAVSSIGYIASTLENRLGDLHVAYADPEVEVIVAANGGWNSSHLLKGIDYELIKKNPKPLVGFSDISVLLNAIYSNTGTRQIHGPMITWGFYENNDITNESFMKAIKNETQKFDMSEFGSVIKEGEFEGDAVGGNIVSLTGLFGTPYEPDWTGKVLFWEETEETVYRLDRVLTHFKNVGIWDKIAGMVIGHLDNIDEEFAGTKTDAWNMMKENFKKYDFPIIHTDLFGHGIPGQLSIPIGDKIKVDKDSVEIG